MQDFNQALNKMREWDYNADAPIALGTFYKKELPTFTERFYQEKTQTKDRDSKHFIEIKKDAKDGGDVAGATRKDIENKLGKTQEKGVVYSDDRSIRFTPLGFQLESQSALDLSKNSGIIALVNGEENAERLKEAGLSSFHGSISASHNKSHPKKIEMPYQAYQAAIFDAFTRRGIEVHIKVVYDHENGKLVGELSSEIVLNKLNVKDIVKDPLSCDGSWITSNHGTPIVLSLADVITIGKARVNNIFNKSRGDIQYKIEELEYACPATDIGKMIGGVLLLYPDGNVARCCVAERGADFGFGNAYEQDIEQIIENIGKSLFHDFKFPDRLKLAHKVMKDEFPDLLPEGGAKEVCEICSPMVSHPEVKERLRQEPLFEYCF